MQNYPACKELKSASYRIRCNNFISLIQSVKFYSIRATSKKTAKALVRFSHAFVIMQCILEISYFKNDLNMQAVNYKEFAQIMTVILF